MNERPSTSIVEHDLDVPSALKEERREKRKAQLIESRKEAQLKNQEKVRAAFKAMEAERIPITASGIAVRAGVARQTVYNSPYIKEIRDAAQRTSVKNRSSMPEQSSDASLRTRLFNALEEIQKLNRSKKRLMEENERLRNERDAVMAQLRAPMTR